MVDMSGGSFSMNKHTISQQDCDSNNGDVSSWYVSLNVIMIWTMVFLNQQFYNLQ